MNQIWIILFAVMWLTTTSADTAILPKPPVFTTESDPEKLLQDYPLGVITLKAAYSHHGKPDKLVLLANGKEGWVYTVGYARKQQTSRSPSSKPGNADDADWRLGVRNYVLVLDERDRVVIDVIYKDDGTGIGVTAMELQYPRPDLKSGP